MKILVISDIHGSETALDKVLKVFNSGEFEKIILCGDLLYHGARNDLPEGYNPKGVLSKLNSIKEKIIAVRGNCESEVDQMVMEFPLMADYSYYKSGDSTLFITHGHIYGPDNIPPLNCGDVFIYGHTHLPIAELMDCIYHFNPGSISIPKGGNLPTYGVISEDSLSIFKLDTNELFVELKR